MSKNFTKFNRDDLREPPAHLFNAIMARIDGEKRRAALKKKIILFGALSLTAFIVLIPAFKELHGEVSRSGFLQFVSLLFSDSALVVLYWKEFAFSMLESLPLFGIIAVFGTILILFIFMKSLFQNINDIIPASPKLIK